MEISKMNFSIRSKKAALEMSMTTIITIVLSVVFLILALTVLRNMYGFQSQSIGAIQDKTLQKINALYLGEEETNQRLWFDNVGDDRVVSIRSGTEYFGIGILGTTKSNIAIQNNSEVQFYIWLDTATPGNCVKLVSEATVKSWFKVPLNTWLTPDRIVDSTGTLVVGMGIPPGTRICQQKIFVKATDKISNPGADTNLGQEYFIINVLRNTPFS